MRFHAKADLLRTLAPDVAVVTECARPEVLLRHEPRLGASGIAWAGRNPRKGLAVLSFGSWRVEPAAEAARDLGTVLPVRIEGGRGFRLVAAWSSPGPPPLRSAGKAKSIPLPRKRREAPPGIEINQFPPHRTEDRAQFSPVNQQVEHRLLDEALFFFPSGTLVVPIHLVGVHPVWVHVWNPIEGGVGRFARTEPPGKGPDLGPPGHRRRRVDRRDPASGRNC